MPGVSHIKIPIAVFIELEKAFISSTREHRRPVPKESQGGGKYKIGLVTLSDLKMHCITIVIQRVG